jgi:Domain of unknown function (DUF4157)
MNKLPAQRIVHSISAFTSPLVGILQRKCACGNHAPQSSECSACAKENQSILRRTNNGSASRHAPESVIDVLHSDGQPLSATARTFMEPRFGRSFDHVRVHADSHAAKSARDVGALAYTVGQHIVFGDGQYAPETGEGRRTLAHELVHVAQQHGRTPALQRLSGGKTATVKLGLPNDAMEQEAESVAESITRTPQLQLDTGGLEVTKGSANGVPILQRRLIVNPTDTVPLPPGVSGPPTLLTTAVQGLLADTCPDGGFQVNLTSGLVTPGRARHCEWHPPLLPNVLEADMSSTPTGCRCLCDVVNNTMTTTIEFHAGGPGTTPVGRTGTGPGSPTIEADPSFQGQYLINGRWVDVPFHLILAHELCGHALPLMRGTQVAPGPGPAGGTPPHERVSVDVERAIAAEHNPPLPRRPEDYSGGARQRP